MSLVWSGVAVARTCGGDMGGETAIASLRVQCFQEKKRKKKLIINATRANQWTKGKANSWRQTRKAEAKSFSALLLFHAGWLVYCC